MISSAEEFLDLRASDDPNLNRRAETEPAPERVWRELIDREPELREWVALNKTIPEGIIRRLSEDSEARVRWIVAQKRQAPPDVLEKLAADRDESVRLRVVLNAKTPPRVLERLAADEWGEVASVARERLADPSRRHSA